MTKTRPATRPPTVTEDSELIQAAYHQGLEPGPTTGIDWDRLLQPFEDAANALIEVSDALTTELWQAYNHGRRIAAGS